jgi:hypothetical protein
MKLFSRTGNPELEGNGIREIVWNGKSVDTDQRIIRGAVGQTTDGAFKTAEVQMTLERGSGGEVSGGHETWKWSGTLHPDKDRAISAARQNVERVVEKDRQVADRHELHTTAGAKAAQKYGRANETVERSITPPSRSR